MNWSDSNSPWATQQRKIVRRQLLHGAMAISFVVLMGGMMLVAMSLGSAGGAIDWSTRLLVFALISGPALAALSYVMYRWQIERRILREVPRNEGRLCTRCRVVLEPKDGEDAAACPRCGRATTLSEAVQYWEQYPHRARLLNSGNPANGSSLPGSNVPRLLKAARRNPVLGFAWILTVWLIFGFGVTAWQGGSVLVHLVSGAWLLAIGGGSLLISLGARRRTDEDCYFCANCEYEISPNDPGEVCPECATDWRSAGSRVRGRLSHKPHLIAIGIALIVLFAFAQIGGSRFTSRVKPTGFLISEIVTAPRGFVMDEWAELGRRTLTPEQELELMRGLIAKRESRHISSEGELWFRSRIAAGAAPDDLAEAYVGGPPVIESVRRVINDDGRMQVEVTVAVPESDDFDMTPVVFIGPLRVDGDVRAEAGEAEKGEPADDAPGPVTIFSSEITGSVADGARTSGELWVTYSHYTLWEPAEEWNADGTPVLAPEVVWHRSIPFEW